MRIARLLVGIGLSFVLAACNGSANGDALASACLDAREQRAALAFGDVRGADDLPEVERNKHVRNLSRTLGTKFVDACKKRGASYAACVAQATTSDEARACDLLSGGKR